MTKEYTIEIRTDDPRPWTRVVATRHEEHQDRMVVDEMCKNRHEAFKTAETFLGRLANKTKKA